MKSRHPLQAAFSILATLILASCQLPFLGGNATSGGTSAQSLSLAATIVNDYIGQVQGTTFTRSVAARTLTNNQLSSTDVASLKTAILAKVQAEGLSNSSQLEKVLPSVMRGISAGVRSLNATTPDTVVASKLLDVAMRSTATSLKNNVTMISDGSAVAKVIQSSFVSATDDLTTLALSDPVHASAALSSGVTGAQAAVQSLGTQAPAADILKAVVSQTVQRAGANAPLVATALFAGVAGATTDPTVLSAVVTDAVVSSATDPTSASTVLKAIEAGLGTAATASQVDAATTALAALPTPIALTSTDTAAIKAVVTEVAPTITMTATTPGQTDLTNLPYSAAGYDITFTVTASSGTTTTLSGGTVGGAQTTVNFASGSATTTLTGSGSYLFTATATNTGGVKSAQASVLIAILAPAPASATPDVQAGLAALQAHQWTAARTAFTTALLKDPTDKDAKVWSSLLDLASLEVDPLMVDLMRNRIGVADYPADLDTLFSSLWLNASAYNYSTSGIVQATGTYNSALHYLIRGDFNGTALTSGTSSWMTYLGVYSTSSWYGDNKVFVPSATGTQYLDWYSDTTGTNYNGQVWAQSHMTDGTVYVVSPSVLTLPMAPLPALSPVTGYQRFDVQNGAVAAGSAYGPTDYPRLLAANVLTRNPLGLNAAVDQVLAGPLGAKLDLIIARLDSLAATDRTYVPDALLTPAYNALAGSVLPPGFPQPGISLGKPELLLLTAYLRSQKAFVQYLGSVNLNFPVGQYALGFVNQTGTLANFYATAPGLYSSGFLGDRGNGLRAASSATFQQAVGNVQDALAAYSTTLADPNGVYTQPLITLFGGPTTGANSLALVQATLGSAKTQIANLQTALSTGTSLLINEQQIGNAPFAPATFIGLFAGQYASSVTQPVVPSALWANNALDPRFWFETNTSGFVFYLSNTSYSTGAPFFVALPADPTTLTAASYGLGAGPATGATYQNVNAVTTLKVKLTSLQAFYPDVPLVSPSGTPWSVPFGVGWNVVSSGSPTYDSAAYTYTFPYTYTLAPPAVVKSFLTWVNKP